MKVYFFALKHDAIFERVYLLYTVTWEACVLNTVRAKLTCQRPSSCALPAGKKNTFDQSCVQLYGCCLFWV